MGVKIDDSSLKYRVIAEFTIQGIVEKPDIIGAIFGQTDGLLPQELDLRELQKQGLIGRIEVNYETKDGKTFGEIVIPSGLNKIRTSIIAATVETVDRVGPCLAEVQLKRIEDIKDIKRQEIIERAAQIMTSWEEEKSETDSFPQLDAFGKEKKKSSSKKSSTRLKEVGKAKLPIGHQFDESKSVIIVEGRADINNLQAAGIGNTIAILGTGIDPSLATLLKEKKTITAFLDGDKGGDLILKELLQIIRPHYVARAPKNKEVEKLSKEEIKKALEAKVPVDEAKFLFGEHAGLTVNDYENGKLSKKPAGKSKKILAKAPPTTRSSKKTSRSGNGRSERKERMEKNGRRSSHRPKHSDQKRLSHVSSSRSRRERDRDRHSYMLPLELSKKIKPFIPEVRGTHEGLLLNEEYMPLQKIPTKDLYETLRSMNNGVKAVVYDGVITPRILELAANKGITTVVATTKTKIENPPENVTYTVFPRT